MSKNKLTPEERVELKDFAKKVLGKYMSERAFTVDCSPTGETWVLLIYPAMLLISKEVVQDAWKTAKENTKFKDIPLYL